MRYSKSGYELVYKKSVIKFVIKQDESTKQKIAQAILGLPFDGDIKKLEGIKIPPTFRIRIGNIRVIYIVNHLDKKITILKIDNRGDIY